MEESDLLKMAGLSTSGVAILLIAWRFLKSLQGKKLVSTCCGRRGEMGVDVVAMTPPGGVALRRLETVGIPTPDEVRIGPFRPVSSTSG